MRVLLPRSPILRVRAFFAGSRKPVFAGASRDCSGFWRRVESVRVLHGSPPSLRACGGSAPNGAPASDSAGCGLDRSPDPAQALRSRGARLLPAVTWETPRAATGAQHEEAGHRRPSLSYFRRPRAPRGADQEISGEGIPSQHRQDRTSNNTRNTFFTPRESGARCCNSSPMVSITSWAGSGSALSPWGITNAIPRTRFVAYEKRRRTKASVRAG